LDNDKRYDAFVNVGGLDGLRGNAFNSFAMTIFHKITKSAKLVILLIIPTYAKVSSSLFTNTLSLPQ
jgi:hypothetical protein